jgi:hypothetical protein
MVLLVVLVDRVVIGVIQSDMPSVVGCWVCWLVCWTVGWLVGCCWVGWLIGWLAGWFDGWLVGFRDGTLVPCLVGWVVGWMDAVQIGIQLALQLALQLAIHVAIELVLTLDIPIARQRDPYTRDMQVHFAVREMHLRIMEFAAGINMVRQRDGWVVCLLPRPLRSSANRKNEHRIDSATSTSRDTICKPTSSNASTILTRRQ